MITYVATPDYYNDYLMHHGVKGMKWGVRKKQLMAKGMTRRQARKQYKKEKAYNKALDDVKYKVNYNKKEAEKAERDVADLKKFGSESNAYQVWKNNDKRYKERGYQLRTGRSDYNTSLEKAFDDGARWLNTDKNVKNLIQERTRDASYYKQKSKSFDDEYKKIKNAGIESFSKKQKAESRRLAIGMAGAVAGVALTTILIAATDPNRQKTSTRDRLSSPQRKPKEKVYTAKYDRKRGVYR